MATENPEDLIRKQANQIENFINDDLPIRLRKKTIDHFKENFQEEGFKNNGSHKWQEVKRRESDKTKGVARTRKILTGETEELGESLNAEPGKAELTVYSDQPYAEAHNEGTTTAGRGNRTTIPQRQFMGDSQELEDIVREEFERGLEELIGF